MNRVTRRDFLKVATAGSAAAGVLPAMTALSADSVAGAGDRVRVALVGLGNKGGHHLGVFQDLPGIVAVCDADAKRATAAADRVAKAGKARPTQVQDMRRVFDDDSIDAIVTATPNHWHALVTLWALQAGKHVYVEKPVTHNVFEGEVLLKAAAKYGKIVQAGFQNRSDVGLRKFFPWLHDGGLGKIELLYGQCFRNRTGIGARRSEPLDPAVAASTVDYNLWLGPADDIPMYRPKFHYDWHWVWNTGNGDIGNQGVHELDLLMWARGSNALPQRVMSFGQRFGWNDAGETPNVQLASFDFGDYPCYFEVRDLSMNRQSKSVTPNHRMRTGLYVKGEKGFFRGGRGGGKAYDHDGNMLKQFKGDGGRQHARNFIEAIRAGKPGMIRAKLDDGVAASDLGHLANVALQSGKAAVSDEVRAYLKHDDKALETLAFMDDYVKGWDVDTSKDGYQFGPWLTFDPAKRIFTGGQELQAANARLTRAYRNEFVVKAPA